MPRLATPASSDGDQQYCRQRRAKSTPAAMIAAADEFDADGISRYGAHYDAEHRHNNRWRVEFQNAAAPAITQHDAAKEPDDARAIIRSGESTIGCRSPPLLRPCHNTAVKLYQLPFSARDSAPISHKSKCRLWARRPAQQLRRSHTSNTSFISTCRKSLLRFGVCR